MGCLAFVPDATTIFPDVIYISLCLSFYPQFSQFPCLVLPVPFNYLLK